MLAPSKLLNNNEYHQKIQSKVSVFMATRHDTFTCLVVTTENFISSRN